MSIDIEFTNSDFISIEDKNIVKLFLTKYVTDFNNLILKMYRGNNINSNIIKAFHRPFMYNPNSIYLLGDYFGYYPNFTIDIMKQYIDGKISSEQIMYYSGDIGCWSTDGMEEIGEAARLYQLNDAIERKHIKDIKKFYNEKIDINKKDLIDKIEINTYLTAHKYYMKWIQENLKKYYIEPVKTNGDIKIDFSNVMKDLIKRNKRNKRK